MSDCVHECDCLMVLAQINVSCGTKYKSRLLYALPNFKHCLVDRYKEFGNEVSTAYTLYGADISVYSPEDTESRHD